jgi:hypothetical protein
LILGGVGVLSAGWVGILLCCGIFCEGWGLTAFSVGNVG